jgi:hypothetical protein
VRHLQVKQEDVARYGTMGRNTPKKLLFTPRHDFFSLDAGALITLQGRGIFEWTWAVGIRNSHDKTFPAGLVAGTKVFCCDNLAFSGEVQISRKHTRFAERDLTHLTARAVGQDWALFDDLKLIRGRYRVTKIAKARCFQTNRNLHERLALCHWGSSACLPQVRLCQWLISLLGNLICNPLRSVFARL